MQIDPWVQTNHQEIRPLLPDNGFGSLAIFLQQKVESRLQGQSCASFVASAGSFLAYPLGVSVDLTDKSVIEPFSMSCKH